ncbi:MAG: RHS repeat-associated core domain-containing protein [Dehalococcoidia bacterium]
MKRLLLVVVVTASLLELDGAHLVQAGPPSSPLSPSVPNGNFSAGTAGWSIVQGQGQATAVEEAFPPASEDFDTPSCEAIHHPGFTGTAAKVTVNSGISTVLESSPFSVPPNAHTIIVDTKRLTGDGLISIRVREQGSPNQFDDVLFTYAAPPGSSSAAHTICDLGGYAGRNVHIQIVGIAGGESAVAIQGPWPISQEGSAQTDDPIDLSTGVFTHGHTDLLLPGRGMPLEFTRMYNPVLSGAGTLGARWTHNYEMRVDELDEGALMTYAGGGTTLFDLVSGLYVSPNGNFDRLARPGLPDNTFELTTKTQIRFQFRSDGKLKKILDRNGNATTITYDPDGLLDIVTDSGGRILDFTNDAQGRITRVDDPQVTPTRSVQFAYTAVGDLWTVTGVRGGVTSFTYSSHRLVTITDANGNAAQPLYAITTNVYDGYNRVDRQVDGEGNVTCIFYGVGPANTHCPGTQPPPAPAAGETILVNPRGFRTTYRYDSSFRTTEIVEPVVELGTPPGVVTFRYEDPAFPLGTHCSTNGGVDRHLCEVTDQGDGLTRHTSKFTYDDRGNVLSVADPRAKVWLFTYTALNDLDIEQDPLLRTTDYGYNANGNLTSITRKDEFGVIVDPPTVVGRAENGDLESITDGNGHTTTLEYDGNGLLDTVTNAVPPPNGPNVTDYDFDAAGRLTEVTDAEGAFSTFESDNQNNITEVSQHRAQDGLIMTGASYQYDAKGNRTLVQDSDLNQTMFAYDRMDRLRTVTTPLQKVTTYSYDPNGNLQTRTDPRTPPRAVSYEYDALDRMTKIDYADDDYNVNFSYQPDGLRQCMVVVAHLTKDDCNETVNRTTYEYFDDHRLRTVIDRIGTTEQATVNYTYDDVGNRETIAYPSPGPVVTYGYDAFNRLEQVSWPGNQVIYGYDDAGNLDIATTLLSGDDLIADWDYDEADRLINVTNELGAAPPFSTFDYELDGVGNRDRMADSGSVTDYDYDGLYRLASANFPALGGPERTYEYDGRGNRLNKNEDGVFTSYIFDDADRLTHQCDGSATCAVQDADVTYTYEGHGTLAHIGPDQTQGNPANQFPLVDYDQHYLRIGHCYDQSLGEAFDGTVAIGDVGALVQAFGQSEGGPSYDARKDITPVGGPDGIITIGDIGAGVAQFGQSCPDNGQFSYNGDGLRTTKWAGATRADYVWDMGGALPVMLRERSGGVDTFYVYGLDLIASVSGSTSSYYAYDGLGSTTEVVNGTTGGRTSYRYDPFGELLSGPASGQPFRFTGEQQDPDVARDPYYLRARYYDPEIGRFWSKDPAGGSSNQPQSWNLYSYVLNNPVNLVDPSGRDAEAPTPIPAPIAPATLDLCDDEYGECVAYGKRLGVSDAHFICQPFFDKCSGKRGQPGTGYFDKQGAKAAFRERGFGGDDSWSSSFIDGIGEGVGSMLDAIADALGGGSDACY